MQKSIPLKLKSVGSSAVALGEAVEVIGNFRGCPFDICAQARNSHGPFIHIISYGHRMGIPDSKSMRLFDYTEDKISFLLDAHE